MIRFKHFISLLEAKIDDYKAQEKDISTQHDLEGKHKSAADIINTEIQPISDARGTAEYKRLLLRQLFIAHFAGYKNELLNELLTTA
jgi:xanthine dehydrogenase iron-sulfur cluster and FAD-binding subunit A